MESRRRLILFALCAVAVLGFVYLKLSQVSPAETAKLVKPAINPRQLQADEARTAQAPVPNATPFPDSYGISETPVQPPLSKINDPEIANRAEETEPPLTSPTNDYVKMGLPADIESQGPTTSEPLRSSTDGADGNDGAE